ncbi:MAG: CehA/McbA family metallohydrolase [Verrucomicrobia bacterium]|nr:CehA/McbA family metallohydrolase [Verrucomicrobiota bacterium]
MRTSRKIAVLLALTIGCFHTRPCAQDNIANPFKTVRVRIVNENGQATPARVRFSDTDGTYYAPHGHDPDFGLSQGGDVLLDNGRRFAYVDGEFDIDLPETDLTVEVVKGYAYRFVNIPFNAATISDEWEIQLERWFEFPGNRWFSGDVHVHHISPETALLEMKAEDLNVCNILTSDFTKDQHHFTGAPDSLSESNNIIYVNQEYRMNWLGHMNLLNLKELIKPVLHQQTYFDPLLSDAADKTHAQGGHVSWAHFVQWPGLEGPLGLVMKKIDSVELLCNLMPFHEAQRDYAHVVPEFQMNPGLRIWYRLLNSGLRIPITAGTDKMSNWVTVGGSRVFAKVEGSFNYQNWINALDAGKTFVTNSPFLFLTVEGKEPGDTIQWEANKRLRIETEVWSQMPLDRLEIIVNGEMIADKIIESGQEHVSLSISYTPRESVWIAARAHQFYEKEKMNGVSFSQPREKGGGPTYLNQYFGTLRAMTTFSHTSPVYVIQDNSPIRSVTDAEYFIRYLINSRTWLETNGKFSSEQSKQSVLGKFEDGIAEFKKLADEDSHTSN